MTDSGHDASEGFIFLEILIALAILAIAFGFAFDALSGGLDWLARSRTEQGAVSLAQATLARVGHEIPLRDGETRGTDGRDLSWQLVIVPYGEADQPSWGRWAAHQVAVTVSWTSLRHARQMRLTSIRLGPREVTP